MFAPEVIQEYIALYEKSLEKVAEQYDVRLDELLDAGEEDSDAETP